MRNSRARIVVTTLFVLALAAGVASGVLAERLRPANAPATANISPLAAELQLTPQQTEQMRQIWEGVRDKSDDCYQQAQDLQRQRDQALVSLLSDEQKTRFAVIDKEFADRSAAMKARRDATFQDAVARTEKILSESQRQKYEEIVRSRVGPGALGSSSQVAPGTQPVGDIMRP